MTLITYKWSIAEWHELVNSGILEGKPVELLGSIPLFDTHIFNALSSERKS